jgi:penicillin amidase
MITDQHSEFARLLTPYILRLNNDPGELTSAESVALTALSEWDYEMDPQLIAPTILEFFRISFRKNLFSDEVDELSDQQGDLLFEFYIYKLLTTGSGDWADNIHTPEKETLNDIVKQSFKESVNSLVRQNGRNPENWKWGKIHTITFMHPFGSIHILASVYNLNSDKYAVGGNEYTVCPYFSYKPGFKADLGASVRHIFNTADWDESYSVIPGGASGIPGSEFYLSQVKTYVEGGFYKEHFSDTAVKSSVKYFQLFIPSQ